MTSDQVKGVVHCETGANSNGALRPFYSAAIGKNPYGPQGGRAGKAVDGFFLRNQRFGTKLFNSMYFERREHAQAAIDEYFANKGE